MPDVIHAIQTFNAGRDPERLALKYANMRASPFVFLRGTCHLFYRRLPDVPVLAEAPAVWCCGDLHLQNFGSYMGDNRLAYFDINDFDESALAPASWDLVRFLTSVLVGAGSMDVKKKEAGELCEAFLDGYCLTLVSGKAGWVERESAHGLIGDLLGSLKGRLRPAFLDSRTTLKGKRRRLRVDNGKALPASDAARAKVTQLIGELAASRDDPRFYEVLDVARRIAGTGSLGVDRYVILVRGKGSPDGNYLLDLKEALPSSLTPYLKIPSRPGKPRPNGRWQSSGGCRWFPRPSSSRSVSESAPTCCGICSRPATASAWTWDAPASMPCAGASRRWAVSSPLPSYAAAGAMARRLPTR